MVVRVLLIALVLAGLRPTPVEAQGDAKLTVGVRPDRVRVGDTFVLTVRVAGGGWPEVLDLDSLPGGEVLDVRDRSSTALGGGGANLVLERDFVIRALRSGNVAPEGVFAAWGADTVRVAAPAVEAVGSLVAWADGTASARRQRDDPVVRDRGLPPTANGRDADRERAPEGLYPPFYRGIPSERTGWMGGAYAPGYPFGGQGYSPMSGSPFGSQGYPIGSLNPMVPGAGYGGYGGYPGGSPYAPSGWGVAPPGGGWAPSAGGDPWWPELVPRLEHYDTGAEDPSGIVTLEAGLTPVRAYVGQQVTLVATATFAPEALARLGSTPEFFPPSAGDAWAVEIPYAPPTPAAQGGRVQEAHTFMRAFFPVTPGVLTVEPARLRYAAGSGGASARPQDELVTEALRVDVLPVPERDAPPGWTGAVGRYRVSAWLQPNSVGWGEAALLTVEIAGAGNVRALTRPNPGEVWGAELRATGERAFAEVRDGVVGGVKTFSWLVVPVEPGALRIGPVIFSFFDPWMGAFGQVASEEVILEALPFPGVGGAMGVGPGPSAPGNRFSGADRPVESTEAFSPTEGPEGMGEEVPVDRSNTESPVVSGDPHGAVGAVTLAQPYLAAPEAESQALVEQLQADPGNGDGWLSLSRAYAQARPGEGWAEWALLSGVRHAPRHEGLRSALRDDANLARDGVPGVPRIPLTARESLMVATLAGTLALALAGFAARVPAGRQAARLGVSAVVMLAALTTLEPWLVHRKGDGHAVAVEGPVDLRAAPAWSSEPVGTVASGTPLRVEERYGDWVRVGGADARGWAESAQVVPLDRDR